MNLSKECLVINIKIGTFNGQKKDREASRDLARNKGAKEDAVSVNKHTIPSSAIKPITTAVGRLRNNFKAQTLPWKDSGDRLLPRKAYPRFIEGHEKLVQEHDDAVEAFVNGFHDPKTKEFFCGYAAVREQAEFRMGSLFREEDYPRVENLRKKFYVALDIDAVSKGFDIRLGDTEGVIQARINKAVSGLWTRMEGPLKHFAEVMRGEPTFRQPTIDTLREMLVMVGELNFTGDERLEALRAEIEARLATFDAKDLRENDKLRESVGEEADRILDTLRGYITATGAEEEE